MDIGTTSPAAGIRSLPNKRTLLMIGILAILAIGTLAFGFSSFAASTTTSTTNTSTSSGSTHSDGSTSGAHCQNSGQSSASGIPSSTSTTT